MDLSSFKKKLGPLPVWGWMGIGLLGALALAGYNKDQNDKKKPSSDEGAETVPADQVPSYIVQIYNQGATGGTGGGTGTDDGGGDDNEPSTGGGTTTPTAPPTAPPSSRPTPTPAAPVIPSGVKPIGNSGSAVYPTGGKTPATPKPSGATFNTPRTSKQKVVTYTVKSGDTLSSIARKFHTTVDAIWRYNTTKGNRPDSTIATLKARGKNKIYAGSTFLIPQ